MKGKGERRFKREDVFLRVYDNVVKDRASMREDKSHLCRAIDKQNYLHEILTQISVFAIS